MKVMQIMGGSGEGGLEKHVVELSNEMSKHCDVVVVAHEKYKDRFVDDVEFVPLDLSKSRRSLSLLYKLLKIVQSHKPDIVHAQANKAGLMVASIRRFLPCKTAVTIHNLKKNLNFTKHFDLSIGVSKGVSQQLTGDNRITTIYNGINKPDVTGNQLHLPDFSDSELPLILAVGRLVPAKGFDVLLEAWQGVEANLLIAGEGPDRAELETLIERSDHLQKHVKLLGNRSDIAALIERAELVVISSRREGFSYVFSETLLSRTPVISTDVPIPNEILPSEYICPVECSDSLQKMINQTLSCRDQLQERFQPIFDYADGHLQIDNMVQSSLSEYRTVLGLGS